MDKSSIKIDTGDTWTLNGKHKFYCEDMLNLTIQADFIYTDPPWNQSILNQFYARANAPSEDFFPFLLKRVKHLREQCPEGLIFIEFGIRTYDLLTKSFAFYGGKNLYTEYCTYTPNKIKMIISCFTFGEPRNIFIPEGLHEWATAEYCISHYSQPEQIMLEPFCGMGYQARIGIKNGLILRGIEIIPTKFKNIITKTKGDWTCQKRNPNQNR